MATLIFSEVWDHHPYSDTPCDTTYFRDQCAIRFGVALEGAGANLASFPGAKYYPGLKHSPKYVLRAQELANWLKTQTVLVGPVQTFKRTLGVGSLSLMWLM